MRARALLSGKRATALRRPFRLEESSPARGYDARDGRSNSCGHRPHFLSDLVVRSVPIARASKTKTDDVNAIDYEAEEPLGPAALDTLKTLEFNKICEQVASFASTTLGKRRCMEIRPGVTQAESELLLSETAAADIIEGEFAVSLDFGGIATTIADEALARASRGGVLTGVQLQSVATLVNGAQNLTRQLSTVMRSVREAEGSDGRMGAALSVLNVADKIDLKGDLVSRISAAIDDEGVVRDAASDELRNARQRVRTIENRIRNLIKSQSTRGEVVEVSGRLCVQVAQAAIDPSAASRSGLVVGSGGGTVILEPPAVVPLNNDLQSAKADATAAEDAVLWALTGLLLGSMAELRQALEFVLWLDVTVARARFSRWIEGMRPEFVPFPTNTSRTRKRRQQQQQQQQQTSAVDEEDEAAIAEREYVSLRRLRHPLLAAAHLKWKEQAMRNDRLRSSFGSSSTAAASSSAAAAEPSSGRSSSLLERLQSQGMGKRTPPPSPGDLKGGEVSIDDPAARPPVAIDIVIEAGIRCALITGPNTGGKTAALKAFGLAVLMSKSGLYVPCGGLAARLPWFSQVLADIGDEQSLSASLSTFSGHLTRIQRLRTESDSKSLVMLDEIGTGTDPTEGSALGIALLQRLVKGGPGGAGLVFGTTHMGALTGLKYSDASFENASVEFDEEAMAPTYRLLWGVPGRSNALNIAARLGLAGTDKGAVTLARARGLMGSGQADVQEAIVDLENARKRLEEDEQATERARRDQEKISAEIRARRRELVEQSAKLDLRERDRMQDVLAELQRLVQLKKREEREKTNAAVKVQAEVQRNEVKRAEKKALQVGWVPAEGEKVGVPKLGGKSTGKVLAVKGGGRCTVQVGLLKLDLAVEDLEKI